MDREGAGFQRLGNRIGCAFPLGRVLRMPELILPWVLEGLDLFSPYCRWYPLSTENLRQPHL